MEIAGDVSPSEREALTKEFRDLEEIRDREAKSRAVVLEILGDIPDADITPPKNVLFVCKLNPVTEEGDLKIIFSRFGNVKKCDIIKDYVTGDSLQYAFIEFDTEESCNEAYFKMQNVLIDDRRIHVDFCQSVSGFWKRYHFKETFTRKRKERSGYRSSDHNRRNPERYDAHSESARRITSREVSGRRKDHRDRYTRRSVSRGSISRSEDTHRSTSTSLDSNISHLSDHRNTKGSRYRSPPRRSRLSISHSEDSRRKQRRPRRRNENRDRLRKHRTRSRSRSRDHAKKYRSRSRSRDRPRKHRRNISP